MTRSQPWRSQNNLFRPYSAIFRHIQVAQHLHMEKSGLFIILEYLLHFDNCIMVHVQNTVIFTKIGKPCITLEILENPGILIILEYSEPDIFKTWNMFRNLSMIKESVLERECFAKTVKGYNYFSKVVYLRSLTGF